jgi:hypothetical protein
MFHEPALYPASTSEAPAGGLGAAAMPAAAPFYSSFQTRTPFNLSASVGGILERA